jgi:hypothetical protein
MLQMSSVSVLNSYGYFQQQLYRESNVTCTGFWVLYRMGDLWVAGKAYQLKWVPSVEERFNLTSLMFRALIRGKKQIKYSNKYSLIHVCNLYRVIEKDGRDFKLL